MALPQWWDGPCRLCLYQPMLRSRSAARSPFDLLDDIATTDQLVLVDALNSGGEPGMCTVVDVSELPALVASSECAHGTSVSHILDFVRYLACDGAACGVAIAGIEGRQFLSCGTGFSEEVWAAVPKLVDLVLLFGGCQGGGAHHGDRDLPRPAHRAVEGEEAGRSGGAQGAGLTAR